MSLLIWIKPPATAKESTSLYMVHLLYPVSYRAPCTSLYLTLFHFWLQALYQRLIFTHWLVLHSLTSHTPTTLCFSAVPALETVLAEPIFSFRNRGKIYPYDYSYWNNHNLTLIKNKPLTAYGLFYKTISLFKSLEVLQNSNQVLFLMYTLSKQWPVLTVLYFFFF